jgi:hypothetical protein
MPPSTLKDQMGHADIRTTLQYVSPDHTEVFRQVDGAFTPKDSVPWEDGARERAGTRTGRARNRGDDLPAPQPSPKSPVQRGRQGGNVVPFRRPR